MIRICEAKLGSGKVTSSARYGRTVKLIPLFNEIGLSGLKFTLQGPAYAPAGADETGATLTTTPGEATPFGRPLVWRAQDPSAGRSATATTSGMSLSILGCAFTRAVAVSLTNTPPTS